MHIGVDGVHTGFWCLFTCFGLDEHTCDFFMPYVKLLALIPCYIWLGAAISTFKHMTLLIMSPNERNEVYWFFADD